MNKECLLWDNFCKLTKINNFSFLSFNEYIKKIDIVFKKVHKKYTDIKREKKKQVFNRPRIKIDNDYKYTIDGELAYLLDCICNDAKLDNDDALIILLDTTPA